MKIVIFTNENSTRIQYAFREILRYGPFTELLWVDKEQDLPHDIPIVNYSLKSIQRECLHFEPCGLLENGKSLDSLPLWHVWDELPVFFKASENHSGVPYDLPAAVFYLLSRMEEYDEISRDEMGRFCGIGSWLHRSGNIDVPLVDLYRVKMHEQLSSIFQQDWQVKFPLRWQCTVDVDMAFAFTHQAWYRTLISALKELITFDFKSLSARYKTLSGQQKDPFDTYTQFKKWVGDEYDNLIFFFLVSNGFGSDKSLNTKRKAFRELIRSLQHNYKIGIHPSIGSHKADKILKREIAQLAKALDKKITRSRQHFLKLTIPTTYRKLIEQEIKYDYTMGYHDISGYRAGTTSPFYWYDLEREQITDLRVHPFYTMDVTLKKYNGLDPDQAWDKLEKHIKYLASKGLPFVFLWHNSSMSHVMGWEKWADFPERLIQFLKMQYSGKYFGQSKS